MQEKKSCIIKLVKTTSALIFILISQWLTAQSKSLHLRFNDNDLKDYSIKDGGKLHFIDKYGNKISRNIMILSDTSFITLNFFLETEDTLFLSDISMVRNRTISRKHLRRSFFYGFIPYVGAVLSPIQFVKFIVAQRYFPVEAIKIELIPANTSN